MEGEPTETSDLSLPASLVAELDDLDRRQLREVVRYVRRRLRASRTSVSDRIQPAPGEEIVAVEERAMYTEVIKREPCGENCPDCPHGPYLYHVYEEHRPDRSDSLHWVFLGRVFEDDNREKSCPDGDDE